MLERGLLDAKRLDDILSVEAMTKPGIVGADKLGRAGKAGKEEKRRRSVTRKLRLGLHRAILL